MRFEIIKVGLVSSFCKSLKARSEDKIALRLIAAFLKAWASGNRDMDFFSGNFFEIFCKIIEYHGCALRNG